MKKYTKASELVMNLCRGRIRTAKEYMLLSEHNRFVGFKTDALYFSSLATMKVETFGGQVMYTISDITGSAQEVKAV